MNGASLQPTNRQNRRPEAANDAGIERKRQAMALTQCNMAIHSHECTEVMVKLRCRRCLGRVATMCDKSDNR